MARDASKLEEVLQRIWIGRYSTPYPGQIEPFNATEARAMARAVAENGRFGVSRLFSSSPCLGVWATLAPLAENYGSGSSEVYRHISDALGIDLMDPLKRQAFKQSYRIAAARIGVALSGNDPTPLFFAPLGVADSQIQALADAIIAAMARLGPPATEDTPMAVAWQCRALQWCPETLSRLRAAVLFDKVGHYAVRSNRWRMGERPETSRDEILYTALDRAARAQGVKKEHIVSPPTIIWFRDGLAIFPEPAKIAQTIKIGAFPTRLSGGVPQVLPTPWPENFIWSAGRHQTVSVTPKTNEILLFNADTGALEQRADVGDGSITLNSSRHIALAARDFQTSSFGPAEPAEDGRYRLAWVDLDEDTKLEFASGEQIEILRGVGPSIRLDARVLGHSGTRPLYAGKGFLHIQLNPALPGSRLLRLSTETRVRHVPIVPDQNGRARVDFESLGLANSGDPVRAKFEVLVIGAKKEADARAELQTTAFVWPGVSRHSSGDIIDAPVPSTYDVARSGGFDCAKGRIWMNSEAAVEAAILAVRIEGNLVEFLCPFRGIRLWRNKVATGDRERVPRGAHLILSNNSRNDTLTLHAPGCRANIRILGALNRSPLVNRTEFTIGAELLEKSFDDRILLEFPNGSSELLARITRVDDPIELGVGEDHSVLRITFKPQNRIDAVGVRIDTVSGEVHQGFAALGGRSVTARLPQGVSVQTDARQQVEIKVSWQNTFSPARMEISTRRSGFDHFEPVCGVDGHIAAVGLKGAKVAVNAANLLSLTKLLVEPTSVSTRVQLSETLGSYLQEITTEMGREHIASRILPALAAERSSGGLSRANVLGGAPWLFEAPLPVFGRLGTHPDLSPLARMANVEAPSDLPDPSGDAPLLAWLNRIASGDGLPRELSAGGLDAAFVAIRTRLARPDLAEMTNDSAVGNAVRLLSFVDVPELDRLRAFDRTMGHDLLGARLVSLIERFARASRLKKAEAAFSEIVRRTGLSHVEVGDTLTLICRVGVEALAHFLTVWDHAVREHAKQKLEA